MFVGRACGVVGSCLQRIFSSSIFWVLCSRKVRRAREPCLSGARLRPRGLRARGVDRPGAQHRPGATVGGVVAALPIAAGLPMPGRDRGGARLVGLLGHPGHSKCARAKGRLPVGLTTPAAIAKKNTKRCSAAAGRRVRRRARRRPSSRRACSSRRRAGWPPSWPTPTPWAASASRSSTFSWRRSRPPPSSCAPPTPPCRCGGAAGWALCVCARAGASGEYCY